MTFRAVIIGLICGLAIAGGAYINDRVLELESLLAGHLIPAIVVGVLVLAVIALVPLLGVLWPRATLSPREIATVVMLMLVACSIPGRGLMEQFTSIVAMPGHWYTLSPGWREQRLMEYIPPELVLSVDDQTRATFIGGAAEGKSTSIADVPWTVWREPLTAWLPMILATAAAVICMGLVVHRQWSRREHLRYPIADFMTILVQRRDGSLLSPIFRSKLFWIALGIVLGIRIINGLHRWFPEQMIQIPLSLDFRGFGAVLPVVRRTPWGWGLLMPVIYPIVVGFSFFLSREISLTLGVSQLLVVGLMAVFVAQGVNMSSSYMAGGAMGWHRSGAYTAFGLIVLYLGRRHYWGVLQCALTFRRDSEVLGYEVGAARGLIASVVVLTGLMIAVGLDWPLAILTVAIMMVSFLGVSRICAETGLFLIHPRFQAMGVLLGLLGAYAMGPKGMVLCAMLCMVLSLDPSMSLMPHFVNALRLCDNVGISPSRVGRASAGMYLGGLALAVVVVLWANYHFGVSKYSWSFHRVPTMQFRHPARELMRMEVYGQVDASSQLSPLQRITQMKPQAKFVWAAAAGFVLVIVVSILRMRLSWWPLHPVLFLVWATYAMSTLAFSFLLGWAIKTAISRLGGERTVRKCMPLAVGMIAGDLLGVVVFMVHGMGYYLGTDTLPAVYRYFPR